MVSAARQKTKAKKKKPAARPAPAKKHSPPAPKKAARPVRKAAPPRPKTTSASSKSSTPAEVVEAELTVPAPDGRRHVLSLSFVRDGDEFLARLETDGGHITEFKNRSLDQLLTLVAGELEDLVE
jgi:sRNA-binding protein